jgi:transposase-like protein
VAGDRGRQFWLAVLNDLRRRGAGWGGRYPATVRAWRQAWEHVTPFPSPPEELRRAVYTTNTIEGLHRQIRKAIKTRGRFPDQQAATKLFYSAHADDVLLARRDTLDRAIDVLAASSAGAPTIA